MGKRYRKILSLFICLIFLFTNISGQGTLAFAQSISSLPLPGTLLNVTAPFMPPVLKGIRAYPQDPFSFDFIVDLGKQNLGEDDLSDESSKMIKYFLAALTIEDEDQWVNLSPYEKERIVPAAFGQTEMGRDLLAQDYILKQMTASLMDPEG